MQPAESSLSTASCPAQEEESESAQVTGGGAAQEPEEPQECTVRATRSHWTCEVLEHDGMKGRWAKRTARRRDLLIVFNLSTVQLSSTTELCGYF